MSDPEPPPPCAHVGVEAPERAEHFFDGWLTIAAGSALLGFAEFFAIVLGKELQRARRRKAADEEVLKTILRAIVANLAYPLIIGQKPAVAVSLAKPAAKASKRYPTPPGMNALPRIIEQLADRRLLDLMKSRTKGIASSITAHESLVRFVSDQKLTAADLERKAGRQIIVLRNVETSFWNESRRYTEFEYADTAETQRMRREMATINARLARPRIQVIDKPPGLDLSQREMRRCFITGEHGEERFDRGGRLWGGFWQNIAKERRHHLHIDAQRLADIDFVSMHVRLAYLRAGLTPPDEDLYAGILPEALEARYRPAIKVCVSAMLSIEKSFSRRPRGLSEPFPDGWSAKDFRGAILHRHAPIVHIFETGVGGFLMRTESDILVDALLAMDKEDIAALPMHDGLMVPRRQAQRAECIMGDAAERQTGFRLPTKCTLL